MNPYTVLNVTKDADALQLKKAYKRALLKYHPDKAGSQTLAYTIDDVNLAYKQLLSDEPATANENVEAVVSYSEVLDLSDFDFEETNEIWTKRCRCGENGYVLTVDDLESNGDADEIAVQCLNCSLWVLVQYSVET